MNHGARYLAALGVASALTLAACDAAPKEPAGALRAGSQRGGFGPLAAQLVAASLEARILCFGERHGSSADADLRSALLGHPEFALHFGQVLFEGASAAHQEVLDRYVLEGEDVAPEELARIWRDAGRGLQWRLPIYRRLFEEVRTLNQRLPAARRVRLLGGAPPIPWDSMRSPEELAPWIDRKDWLHQRMRELLDEPRATLAVYGRHHCERLRFASDAALDEGVLSVLSVGPDEDAEFRRRVDVGGGRAEVVGLDELRRQRLVRDVWGDGHLYRGSRFGEVADLVVSYGDLDHRILWMREEDLPPSELAELHRRDEWMATAFSTHAEAADP